MKFFNLQCKLLRLSHSLILLFAFQLQFAYNCCIYLVFFQNAMLSSLRHEFCLKILSFLSSQTSVEVGSPRKTSGFDRGAHDFLCRKKAVELRETSPVGSWRRGWNLLFIVCHHKKKKVCCGDHEKCKKMAREKELKHVFYLRHFFTFVFHS